MLQFFSQVRRSARVPVREESGEAVVEFIGLSVILFIPLIYAILALAQVQTGLFAAEGGACEAVRILVDHPEDQVTVLARVELASADFHVPSMPSTEIGCRRYSGELRDVSVAVSTSIPLPLLPTWLGE